MQSKRSLKLRHYMMRKVVMMEDFRTVIYDSIGDLWEVRKPTRSLSTFCKFLDNNDIYTSRDKSINIFFYDNQTAWCIALSNVISRRARLTPNPLRLKMMLKKAACEIVKTQLPF